MRLTKRRRDHRPVMNMTPMIDIVFLLIIFFMVGTRFTELSEAEHEMPLEVPTVSQAGALTQAPAKRVVNVTRDGTITLDRRIVTLDELKTELARAIGEYPRLGVIVRGDANGRFQSVASVLGACREAGVSEMGISVRVAARETEIH